MSPLSSLIEIVAGVRDRLQRFRVNRRWAKLCENGMHLGADVWLPDSTWIDPDYCFLISIGDHCGFGAECLILAHDAQMDEFIDAARIGRVIIHPSCHIGSRTVVLPGVEIGPRTIVGANSVVSRYGLCRRSGAGHLLAGRLPDKAPDETWVASDFSVHEKCPDGSGAVANSRGITKPRRLHGRWAFCGASWGRRNAQNALWRAVPTG